MFVIAAADRVLLYAVVVGLLPPSIKKYCLFNPADHPLLKLPFLFEPSQSRTDSAAGGNGRIYRGSASLRSVTRRSLSWFHH